MLWMFPALAGLGWLAYGAFWFETINIEAQTLGVLWLIVSGQVVNGRPKIVVNVDGKKVSGQVVNGRPRIVVNVDGKKTEVTDE